MYKEEKEKLKQEMASISTGISLSFDLWTAATTECFICLTAHYVDTNWKLNRKILNFCVLYEPDLPERIPELLNDWGIENKISSLTFDDSFVDHTVKAQLKSQLALQSPLLSDGEFFHVRCFGRVLSLMILEGLDVARDVLDKIRESVDYVKGSRIRMLNFKECAERVGGVDISVRLRSEMPPRWNSTHLMLESALKYQRVFASLHLYDDNYEICPSPEVWKTGEKVCALLLPFYETTGLISGKSYPTSNLLFLQVWKILCVVIDSLRDEDKVLKSMAEKMFGKIKKYWDQYSVLLAFGVVLDPRMKFSKLADCYSKVEASTCENKLQQVKTKLYVLFEKYSSRSTSSGVQSTIQTQSSSMPKEFNPCALSSETRKSVLDVYLDEPNLEFCDNENLDVLQWWKSNNNRFLDLSTLARDLLSIPITTVLSESPFNFGSCFLDKYRDDFVPDNAEVMICTRNWMYGFASNDAMAQAVENQQGVGENAWSRSLTTFQRENPPTFKGRYNPDGALAWLKKMERIFRVMDCTPAQKVRYGTHMLAEEADDWWLETSQRLGAAGEEITWVVFRREFMRKYYPEDVRGKKEIEFLELKQGNLSVTEYAAKFVELAKFYPYYSEATAEFSKCIKFENGLRPEIKKAIGYQQIRVFSDLIDSCRIYEEDSNAHYKIINEKRSKHQNRGKPYDAPAGKGKTKVADGKRISGGDAHASIVCFKCGKVGHKSNVCKAEAKRCFRCGKTGHEMYECE